MNWVADQHGDLLNAEESAFIHHFHQLEQDSQCLLVRMLSRKGTWFRADKLRYAEINNPAQAAEQLIQYGLVTPDAPLSIAELANLVTKPELLSLFAESLQPHKHQRKDLLVELLIERYPETAPWSAWTNNTLDRLYQLEVQHISDTLRLLFFGNPYQDLTEFVLQDLGLFRYEQYTIDKQHRLFRDRLELFQYQQLILLREQFDLVDSLAALHQLLPTLPEKFDNPAMERRRAKLINQVAYELERHGEWQAALNLYQQVTLPPARERQIRLLEKLGQFDEAWHLLNQVFSSPANEHELQLAHRMAPRLAKKIPPTFVKPLAQPINGLAR